MPRGNLPILLCCAEIEAAKKDGLLKNTKASKKKKKKRERATGFENLDSFCSLNTSIITQYKTFALPDSL